MLIRQNKIKANQIKTGQIRSNPVAARARGSRRAPRRGRPGGRRRADGRRAGGAPQRQHVGRGPWTWPGPGPSATARRVGSCDGGTKQKQNPLAVVTCPASCCVGLSRQPQRALNPRPTCGQIESENCRVVADCSASATPLLTGD